MKTVDLWGVNNEFAVAVHNKKVPKRIGMFFSIQSNEDILQGKSV